MRFSGFFVAVGLLAVPAQATIPIEVAVGAGARAVVEPNDFAFAGQFPAAWGGPGSLGINLVAVAGDASYNVTSSITVEAAWLSGEAGSLAIDWSRAVAGTPPSPAVNVFAGTNNAPSIDGYPANWFYAFTATGNGFFQGSYVVTASGEVFGLQPIYLQSDNVLTILGGNSVDPSGAGSFAIPLVAGQTYRISMFNFGNIGTSSDFDFTGSASARIVWEITGGGGVIPEPGTWAMLIAGFGLVGASLRRRRPSAA